MCRNISIFRMYRWHRFYFNDMVFGTFYRYTYIPLEIVSKPCGTMKPRRNLRDIIELFLRRNFATNRILAMNYTQIGQYRNIDEPDYRILLKLRLKRIEKIFECQNTCQLSKSFSKKCSDWINSKGNPSYK